MYSSVISPFYLGHNGIPIDQMPLVSKFLAGNVRIRPKRVTLPGWSLQPVLNTLCEGPWESLEAVDLELLTIKTVFLLAITSARRVSELSFRFRSKVQVGFS